jgi:hypothetical protein
MSVRLVEKKQRIVMRRKAHHAEHTQQLFLAVADLVKWDWRARAFALDPDPDVPGANLAGRQLLDFDEAEKLDRLHFRGGALP